MSFFLFNIKIRKRGFLALLILYLSASLWQYIFSSQIINKFVESDLWVNTTFNFMIAISILIGAFFVDKINPLKLIYIWGISTPLLMLLSAIVTNSIYLWITISFLGIFFGIGSLAFFNYFHSLTTLEERGRVGGFIVVVSLLLMPLFSILASYSGFIGAIVLCVIFNLSIFTILLLNPKDKIKLTSKENIETQSYSRRTLLLYLIPWLVFSLINGSLSKIVSLHMLELFSDLIFQIVILQGLSAVFGAFVSGIIADFVGRKTVLSLGLVTYGISAVVSVLQPTNNTLYFATIMSGFSWGVFLVGYQLVIWSDFATRKHCAPFYAIGIIPFYFSRGLGFLFTPDILQISVENAAFLSCSLIFLSNISLFLAPELIPLEIKRRIDLRLHLHRVKEMLKKKTKR